MLHLQFDISFIMVPAAKVASKLADEPEFTIKAYFALFFLQIFQIPSFLDIVSCSDFITSIPAER